MKSDSASSSELGRAVIENIISWEYVKSLLPDDMHPYHTDTLIPAEGDLTFFDRSQERSRYSDDPITPTWLVATRLSGVSSNIYSVSTVLEFHQRSCHLHQELLRQHVNVEPSVRCPWIHVEAYMRTSHRCHPLLDIVTIQRMNVEFQSVNEVDASPSMGIDAVNKAATPPQYASQHSIDCAVLLLIFAIGEVKELLREHPIVADPCLPSLGASPKQQLHSTRPEYVWRDKAPSPDGEGSLVECDSAFFHAAVQLLQHSDKSDRLKLVQGNLLAGLYLSSRGEFLASYHHVFQASKALKALLNWYWPPFFDRDRV